MISIPQQARENAKYAIAANYLYHKCKNKTGVKTAEKLISEQNISNLKFARKIFSYLSRAKVYDRQDWTKCGTISYNLWGGDVMYKHLKKTFEYDL